MSEAVTLFLTHKDHAGGLPVPPPVAAAAAVGSAPPVAPASPVARQSSPMTPPVVQAAQPQQIAGGEPKVVNESPASAAVAAAPPAAQIAPAHSHEHIDKPQAAAALQEPQERLPQQRAPVFQPAQEQHLGGHQDRLPPVVANGESQHKHHILLLPKFT